MVDGRLVARIAGVGAGEDFTSRVLEDRRFYLLFPVMIRPGTLLVVHRGWDPFWPYRRTRRWEVGFFFFASAAPLGRMTPAWLQALF